MGDAARAILKTFNTEVAPALYQMQDLHWKQTGAYTDQYTDLELKTNHVMKRMVGVELLGGGAKAVFSFGAALSGTQTQRMFEAWKTAADAAKGTTGTFFNAEQHRLQQLSAQLSQHKRPRETQMEDQMRSTCHKMEEQVNHAVSKSYSMTGHN
jgi:hypothetical protein